jgi:hypothetical protein
LADGYGSLLTVGCTLETTRATRNHASSPFLALGIRIDARVASMGLGDPDALEAYDFVAGSPNDANRRGSENRVISLM